jgi:hypothetical protein
MYKILQNKNKYYIILYIHLFNKIEIKLVSMTD